MLAGLASFAGGLGFFWLPGGIPVLLPCMCLMLVGAMGSFPVLNSYATELFPTALRGQATSSASVARVAGRPPASASAPRSWRDRGLPATPTILGLGSVLAIVIYAVWSPTPTDRARGHRRRRAVQRSSAHG